MVIAREGIVSRELKRRGWSQADLASRMGKDQRTVANILSGRSVAHTTQVALFNALDGQIPFGELFDLTPGDDAAATEEAVTA